MKYALIILMFSCGLAVKACDKGGSSGTKTSQAESSAKGDKPNSKTTSDSPQNAEKSDGGKTKTKETNASVVDSGTKSAEVKKPAGKCDGACPCVEGSKDKKDDSWTRCTLSEAVKVQGNHCAAGRLTFHKSGKLDECNLVKNARIDGYLCRAAPNRVKLHANGKLASCTVAEEAKAGGFTYEQNTGLQLHDDGSPKTAFLKEGSKEVDGYSCTKSIRLFKGGKLQACTLTKDAKLGGQKIPSGYQLILQRNGAIRGLRNWSGKVNYAGKNYGKGKAGAILCFTDGKPDPASKSCRYF